MKDKIKLTFEEMQTFIKFVVTNTMKYGEGYRDVLINYCTSIFYGSKIATDNNSSAITFQAEVTVDNFVEDIAEIYNNEYDMLIAINVDDIDTFQYNTIINAIDREIEKLTKYYSAAMVMSEANEAIANFANMLSGFINKISDMADQIPNTSFETEDIKKVMNALSDIKNNVNSENLVKAMIDNGVISAKKKPTKKSKPVIKSNPDIQVITNSKVGE